MCINKVTKRLLVVAPHAGGVGGQPFFIEGVREALDAKGEWWVDASTDTLYILPNTTSVVDSQMTLKVVAPRLQTLVSIRYCDAQNG
jgi:hypothetical protein